MIIALCIIGYFAVALGCAYVEARLTGESTFGPAYMAWPVFLPILAIAGLFELFGWLGERHHG